MRFRRTALEEIAQRIRGLGLTACPVCSADDLEVLTQPAVQRIGGFPHEPDHPRYDPEGNALFLVLVRCPVCGHVLMFDPEELVGSSEAILVEGLTPEEEAHLEREGGGR